MGRRAGRSEKIKYSEAAGKCAPRHPGVGSLDGERRDIDSEDIETAFRHPDCICTGTCADLKCRTWHDRARSDELDEQRFRFPGVPGWSLSRGVALIPWRVGHHDTSLTRTESGKASASMVSAPSIPNRGKAPRVEGDDRGSGFQRRRCQHQVVRAHPLAGRVILRPQARMFQRRVFRVRDDLKGKQSPFKKLLPCGAVNSGGALHAAPQLRNRNGRQLDLFIRLRERSQASRSSAFRSA